MDLECKSSQAQNVDSTPIARGRLLIVCHEGTETVSDRPTQILPAPERALGRDA